MALRLTEKSDIKVFILYLLSQLERPLDYITLHDICVQDEFVNQFDFVEEFYELLDIKALEMKTNDAGNEMVCLTRKGKNTAETMKDRILPEILDHAVRSALQLISFKSQGLAARSKIEEENGKYRLTCSVNGAGGTHFETSLLLESLRQAEHMRINFDERSEFIYKGILALLSGNMNYLAESWSDDLSEDKDEE